MKIYYNVYKHGILYLKNVTVREFSLHEGYSGLLVARTIMHNETLDGFTFKESE